MQSALHLVVQSAVVETATHWVLQWSSQHALHDAWQSVEDDSDWPPSDEVDIEEVDVHDELQLELHRELQSVVQSNDGGLEAHVVEQLDWQLDAQLASAIELHWLLHCCSSCAAHALSQVAGAHWVEQSLTDTTLQLALASISMLPHADTPARAICGAPSRAARGRAATAQRPQRFFDVFIRGWSCNR